MWVFFDGGFISVVCARKDGGKLDTELLMVRARSRKHLVRLLERFPAILGACEIVESIDTDYRFRLLAPKSSVASVVAELVTQIDYGNFKSRVRDVCGLDAYERALHRVWADMLPVQVSD